MAEVPSAPLNRRRLLQAAVATPVVILAGAEMAEAQDEETYGFAGHVSGHPTETSIEIDTGYRTIVAEASDDSVVRKDGESASVQDFAVGDAVALLLRRNDHPSLTETTFVPALLTPAVLGEASDLKAVRG